MRSRYGRVRALFPRLLSVFPTLPASNVEPRKYDKKEIFITLLQFININTLFCCYRVPIFGSVSCSAANNNIAEKRIHSHIDIYSQRNEDEDEDEIGNNNHKNEAFPSPSDAVKVQRVTKKIKMNYLPVMNCQLPLRMVIKDAAIFQ